MPYREDVGETILRDRISLARGLVQERGSSQFVPGNANPVEQRDRVFDLGVGVIGRGRGGQQPGGLAQVLCHAPALLIEGSQRVLRFRISGLRSRAEELGRPSEVLAKDLSLEIKKGEIIGGSGMAELGSRGEKLRP